MRYVYLGDVLTDPALMGRACDPVRRPDGKCIVSRRMASALVIFAGETVPRVVKRRRLRVVDADAAREPGSLTDAFSSHPNDGTLTVQGSRPA